MSGDDPSAVGRLAKVRAAAAAGGSGEVEGLVDRARAAGGPIVDQRPDGDVDLTFVHRAEAGRVSVVSPLPGPGGAVAGSGGVQLERLGDTDVWAGILRCRRDAAVAYHFRHDDPTDDLSTEERLATFLSQEARGAHFDRLFRCSYADQFNPRRLPPSGLVLHQGSDEGQPEECWDSLLVLPEARQLAWSDRPAEPAYQTFTTRFWSERLGNERTVSICLPRAGARPPGDGTLPLLVGFDAELFLSWNLTDILTNLLEAGRIPPIAVVLLHNADRFSRAHELTCNETVPHMVAEELLPELRRRHDVGHDPDRTVVAGASYGALAATHLAVSRPDLVSGVLALSGAFWWGYAHPYGGDLVTGRDDEPEWLTRQIADRPRADLRFWLNAGQLETESSPLLPGTTLRTANRHLRTVLRAKGYAVSYDEPCAAHDGANWLSALPLGLIDLFQDRRRP